MYHLALRLRLAYSLCLYTVLSCPFLTLVTQRLLPHCIGPQLSSWPGLVSSWNLLSSLCPRQYARWSTYMIPFILNKTTCLLLSPPCRSGTWASERLSVLLKVTQMWENHGTVVRVLLQLWLFPWGHTPIAVTQHVSTPLHTLLTLLCSFLLYTKVARYMPGSHV